MAKDIASYFPVRTAKLHFYNIFLELIKSYGVDQLLEMRTWLKPLWAAFEYDLHV